MSETPVVLPKWGLTMLDATLVEWLKQEGERVEVDDAICLVETDKVDAEVTAPVAGVLGPQLVHKDDVVQVGTTLTTIREDEPPSAACASTTRSSGRVTSRRWPTGSGSATGSRRCPAGATPAGARTTASSRSAAPYLEIIGVADENEALRDPWAAGCSPTRRPATR